MFQSLISIIFSILNNKKQATYEVLFKEIKNNARKFSGNIVIPLKNSTATLKLSYLMLKKVFLKINIKYCVWHYKRILETCQME